MSEAVVNYVEFVFLIIAIIFLIFLFVTSIITEKRRREELKRIDTIFDKMESNESGCDCKLESNYNDMTILELRKVAKQKKIKGYYNLHKKELIKAIKATE